MESGSLLHSGDRRGTFLHQMLEGLLLTFSKGKTFMGKWWEGRKERPCLSVLNLSSSQAFPLGAHTSSLAVYSEDLARLATVLIRQCLRAACYSLFGSLDILYRFLTERHLGCFWMTIFSK